jgi:hypothetical protein
MDETSKTYVWVLGYREDGQTVVTNVLTGEYRAVRIALVEAHARWAGIPIEEDDDPITLDIDETADYDGRVDYALIGSGSMCFFIDRFELEMVE